MRLIVPFLLLFTGIIGSYYYNRFSSRQKKWVKYGIGIGLIIGWCYLVSRFA